MHYKGEAYLSSITIHFGLYDENDTRMHQYSHTRKWINGNDILSEIVEIRINEDIDVAKVKIDGILTSFPDE
jgi:hypothetical protein